MGPENPHRFSRLHPGERLIRLQRGLSGNAPSHGKTFPISAAASLPRPPYTTNSPGFSAPPGSNCSFKHPQRRLCCHPCQRISIPSGGRDTPVANPASDHARRSGPRTLSPPRFLIYLRAHEFPFPPPLHTNQTAINLLHSALTFSSSHAIGRIIIMPPC